MSYTGGMTDKHIQELIQYIKSLDINNIYYNKPPHDNNVGIGGAVFSLLELYEKEREKNTNNNYLYNIIDQINNLDDTHDMNNEEEVRKILFKICLLSDETKFIQFCRTLYDSYVFKNNILINKLVDYIDVNTYKDTEECEFGCRYNCYCRHLDEDISCKECILKNIIKEQEDK